MPGVARIGSAEHRSLDAVYFDTPDLALARAAVALRRRSGGPDAGWHVKTARATGRHEYGWPLDDGSGEPGAIAVPESVRAAVREWVGDAPIAPIARVRNQRTAYALFDASGGVVAEFTDDRVDAIDIRRDAVTTWREWEIELGPAAPADADAFFASAARAVHAVGGRAAASGSKLERALGH